MKGKKNVLDNQIRFNIYSYILFSPGVNFNELCKVFHIKKYNLKYHISCLEKNDFINISNGDGFTRFYVKRLSDEKCNEVVKSSLKFCKQGYFPSDETFSYFKYGWVPDSNDIKIINVLRRKIPYEIFKFLYFNPDSSQIEIGKYLNKHTTTVAFHLARMKRCGIVIGIRKGNKVLYRLDNLEQVCMIFIFAFNYCMDVDDGEPTGKIKLDNYDSLFDNLFEIFPIPFCA